MNNSIYFFNDIIKNYKKKNIKLILVTHLLIDRPEFIRSLSKIIDLALIIPKPKTINKSILEEIKGYDYNIVETTRENLNNKNNSIQLLKKYVGKKKFRYCQVLCVF